MGGGTEVFADLGEHCQNPECRQLDFLPFTCDGCKKVFCLEHRSFKAHDCPKTDNNSRKVFVCEKCSMAIETTGQDDESIKLVIEKHEMSKECDVRRKKKPMCPVKRCRQALTFSNSSTCKNCGIKVCLKHRFPGDHSCHATAVAPKAAVSKFMVALAARNGKDCATGGGHRSGSTSTRVPSLKAC